MDETTAHALLDDAERLLQGGLSEKALDETRRLYGPPLPGPVRGRAFALEIVALEELERFQDAEDLVIERMKEEGDNLAFVLAAGMEFSDLDADDHAEVFFRNLCQLDPDNYVPWYNLAIALGRMGRFLEAVAAYDEALNRNADYAPSHLQKGYCERMMGSVEDAIASYRRYLALEPEDGDTWSELGVLESEAGHLEKAYAAFASAIKAEADPEDTWFNWAVTAIRHKDTDQLRACIDQLQGINPEGWRLQMALADRDALQENLWEAWEHMTEAFDTALESEDEDAAEYVATVVLSFARRHDMAQHAESIVERIFEEELFAEPVLQSIQLLESRFSNHASSYQIVLRVTLNEVGSPEDAEFRVFGVTANNPDEAAELACAFEARCGNPGADIFEAALLPALAIEIVR